VSDGASLSAASVGLALGTVALNSGAQLLLRGAALRGATPTEPLTLLKSPLFIIALAAYGLSVLTWLSVLRKVPLGVAMPFVALTYVVVPIAAWITFGDPISLRTVGGTALIIAGVLVVAVR
jgi:undecaprenyl phosphate-alpha-L-ara4N flippase subunit ArnE